ncbi:MAG: hypothetical protein ABI808_13475 [Pseudonocardiales bacterium]
MSYADVVVEIHVDSEAAEPESAAVKQTHEGLVGRKASVSIVATLWTRSPTFTAPPTATIGVWGWVVHDDKRRPTVPRGGSRIEVGHNYLLAWTSSGIHSGWSSIGPGAEIPFDGGIAGQGERLGADTHNVLAGTSAAFRQVNGLTLAQVTAVVNAAKPDPLAVKYRSLPAVQRFQKVQSERH